MAKYTVIGYHVDNQQPCVAHVNSATARGAPAKAAKAIRKVAGYNGALMFVGVFKGHHMEISGWDETQADLGDPRNVDD